MTGLDTNVLVRYLVQDDKVQSARATRLIERELDEAHPGFLGLVTLVETWWVLRRCYRATPGELRETVRDLLDSAQIVIERRALVAKALRRLEGTDGDLADALVVETALDAGCVRVVTFDKAAARCGMSVLR